MCEINTDKSSKSEARMHVEEEKVSTGWRVVVVVGEGGVYAIIPGMF